MKAALSRVCVVSNGQNSRTGDGLVGLSSAIQIALEVARSRAERTFVVGGVVRDVLMGRDVGEHDLDIVVEGQGIPFARALAERLGSGLREHAPFLTAKLEAPFAISSAVGDVMLDEVDVATARQESYERPGALPTVVAASIEQDLWRRDFSANSIALPLQVYQGVLVGDITKGDVQSHVIDPTQGVVDIQHATLRILHPRSFIDDPTRLFRAVRYIVRLSFHFDMATLAGFLEAVKSGALATLSPRRVWNEVMAAFDESAPCEIIQEFVQRGLFSAIPIVSQTNPSWTLETLERLEQLRGVLGQEIFKEAGKIILIAGLLREGRDDVARAVHEGGKVLQRGGTVLEADKAPGSLRMIPDVAAAYCVHCTRELQELLQACLREQAAKSKK
jgi:tRNA nucleotidyltransferase/poly(A) polymerase